MARTKIFEDQNQGTVYTTNDEDAFLKENGYQKTRLFRLAIKALKDGKLKYTHVDGDSK